MLYSLVLLLTVHHSHSAYVIDHNLTLHDCVRSMFAQRKYVSRHADVAIRVDYECRSNKS